MQIQKKILLALRYLLLLCVLTFIPIQCERHSHPQEIILARVDGKSISVPEFIERAEYTIRPAYCRSDDYIQRKIVLNSLLAEKLLALEAGEDNELIRNAEFQAYLRGRKEQAMRQWFYNEEIYSKVKLDTAEIRRFYRFAGRTYKIHEIIFPDSAAACKIYDDLLKTKESLQTLFQDNGDTLHIPEREIKYSEPENDAVHLALFSDSLRQRQVLGPLKLEQGLYSIIEIKGWTDNLAITDQQVRQRWNTVEEKLKDIQAAQLYTKFVKELMKGKKVEFDRETFIKLVNVVAPDYYKTEQEKRNAFSKKLWNKDSDEMILDDRSGQLQQILEQPLLTIDDQVWKVEDLQEALKIHPLVFRNRKIPKREFAEQFKLAIVDLIRDQYVNREAYAKGYDKAPAVQRNYNMWKDNLLALYQREQYLKTIHADEKDPLLIIEKYLNPYVQQLQKKYNSDIEINTDEFEKVQLTHIDMFVIQQNMPFPVIVPSFPQVTTHDRLDYGRKMIEEKSR